MNAAEAHKIGYMMRCVSRGMEPAQIREHLHKQAGVTGIPGAAAKVTTDAGKAGLDFLKWLAPRAAGAAILAPPVIGAAGGYALSQLHHPDYTEDDVKHDEQLLAYREAIAELARARRQMPAGRR